VDYKMAGNAYIGSLFSGVCTCHEIPISVIGHIVMGSLNVLINNLGQATLGGLAVAQCGHTAQVIIGSSSIFTNEIPSARLGDMVASNCITGTIITASSNVISDSGG